MRSFLLTFLFITAFTCNNFSQVIKDDFTLINKAYADHPAISMKVRYEAFKNKSATKALNTEKGEIIKKNAASYHRIGNIETIINKDYKLIVDHEDKNISLLGIYEESEPDLYPFDLEKILALCSKTAYRKVNDHQACYEMVIPGSEYEEIKLFFNTDTYFIEKLILYYAEAQNLEEKEGAEKEAPRMEVTYSDFHINPDFKQVPFTYGSFLEKKNGKLLAKAPYQSYSVHEQLVK